MIDLIEPHYPKDEGGRPAYPLMAMLRVHLMQNWFGYSDPTMEEALYMRDAKSSGRLWPTAAPTKNMANAARCTKRYARSRKPRLRFAPRLSIHFG